MNEPRLPVSAYVMAVISAGFVFVGVLFIFGGMVMLTTPRGADFPLHVWWFFPAAPLIALVLGALSAWQSLQLARKKMLDDLSARAPEFTCRGCGETFATHEPHCPLCGRKPEGVTSKPVR